MCSMWSDQGSQLCVYCVCPIAVTVLQLARLQPSRTSGVHEFLLLCNLLPCRSTANTPWLRPPLGFLKCNVDEAWFEDVLTTNYAALLRDSHGHVVKCFIGIAQSVMDPSIAKAFVVREALSWLRSFNVDWILMELESS